MHLLPSPSLNTQAKVLLDHLDKYSAQTAKLLDRTMAMYYKSIRLHLQHSCKLKRAHISHHDSNPEWLFGLESSCLSYIINLIRIILHGKASAVPEQGVVKISNMS